MDVPTKNLDFYEGGENEVSMFLLSTGMKDDKNHAVDKGRDFDEV